MINGGVIAIDNLMNAPAIIEAFYPAMRGAEAIARTIFGLDNKWGIFYFNKNKFLLQKYLS